MTTTPTPASQPPAQANTNTVAAPDEQKPIGYLMKYRNGTRERLVRAIPTAKDLAADSGNDYSDAEYIALGPIEQPSPARSDKDADYNAPLDVFRYTTERAKEQMGETLSMLNRKLYAAQESAPSSEGLEQRENAEFTEWWNAKQACPEHSLITENAAHAAWQERARRATAGTTAAPVEECGNCFEGKSDGDHVCRVCNGSGRATAGNAAPTEADDSEGGASALRAEPAGQRIAELERAADYLEQYAKYCYEVKPEDIERHPYIPSIEEAAENLRAMIAEASVNAATRCRAEGGVTCNNSSSELASNTATAAPGDLPDEDIVKVLAELGIDSDPSKYGFNTLQVRTTVPAIRDIVKAYCKVIASNAGAAIPEGCALVPVKITNAMIEAAMVAHYGKRRVQQVGGARGVDMTVDDTNYNGYHAMRNFWKGALSAAPSNSPAGAKEQTK